MSPAPGPLILDFDGSVGPLPGARRIQLARHQDRIRYGCRLADLRRLGGELEALDPGEIRSAFLGSGDFHHVTHLLLERRAAAGPFQVLVFDNHPDNMRFPWGIHCGSWVHHSSRLPFVSRITVVGIASADVRWNHLWENHLGALSRGKVRYLCFAPVSRAARLLRIRGIEDFRASRERFADALAGHLAADPAPIYLSIDKDVLTSGAVRTNWDQGVMSADELLGAVRLLRGRLLGLDVCGEISFHRYEQRWKRMLTRLDGQAARPPADLLLLQAEHHAFNLQLLAAAGLAAGRGHEDVVDAGKVR